MHTMMITTADQLVADRRARYESIATGGRLRRLFSRPAASAAPAVAPLPELAPGTNPAIAGSEAPAVRVDKVA